MHTVVSSKGQVVIPSEIRNELGFSPGKRLRVVRQGRSLVLSKERSDWDHWLSARREKKRLRQPLVLDRSASMPPPPEL